jgi:hypothetical protein
MHCVPCGSAVPGEGSGDLRRTLLVVVEAKGAALLEATQYVQVLLQGIGGPDALHALWQCCARGRGGGGDL